MTTATATAMAAREAARPKLSLKDKYAVLTRDLGWDTTYQPMDKVFPHDKSKAS